MLAITVCQISIFQLTHRNREQARSHKTPSPFAARKACLTHLPAHEVQRLAHRDLVAADEQFHTCAQTQHRGFGQRTEGYWEYPIACRS